MDIYCPVSGCAEPFDFDCLHEEAEESGRTFTEVQRDFAVRGCLAFDALFGPMTHATGNHLKSAVSSAMFDIMGDDVDGVAAMMEDFEYMGAFE